MHLKTTFSYLAIFTLCILFTSCSSTKELSNWRKPDTQDVQYHKVLVIGMGNNIDVRTRFEDKLAKTLNKNGIEAVGSIDFFGDQLLTIPKTLEGWEPLIEQLNSEDFDAVLVTKIVGVEGRDSDSGIVRYYNTIFASFEEDVMKNENLYSEEEGFKDFYIHQVASSLYCLCERDLEEDLIWKNTIELKQAFDTDYLIQEGVRMFTKEFIKKLKQEDLFAKTN
ncbi:hypothetical protein RBU60_11360 [Mesonia sp. MT50]|uniref:Uncharacterized protein n=1 Tax=Mesonia profundi TaxID=3070998 RepID=A0ABU1A3B4_9FLAO|nr:hypothetical protein [Mesonia profundi]MDQ7918177.1 hypothetical protein [Mesonia profundi]